MSSGKRESDADGQHAAEQIDYEVTPHPQISSSRIIAYIKKQHELQVDSGDPIIRCDDRPASTLFNILSSGLVVV